MRTDWIPCELITAGNRTLVKWVHPGTRPLFSEPFFHQTIDALVRANAVQKLTALDDLQAVAPVNTPKGFVFHVSRCGSTLVSRSLAGVPRHRVISEPAPLNQLLLAQNIDPLLRGPLLKGLIHSLCGTQAGAACVFKFTSWNLLFLEQLLKLFPTTPWVFVYREPADVLDSLIARPARWASDSQLLGRLHGGSGGGVDVDTMAAILERLFRAPLPHFDGRALAIGYAQLPNAVLDIARHFDLGSSAAEHAQMLRMGQFDAKQGGEVPFRARVRAPVSDAMALAIAQLNPLFDQWEASRKDSSRVGANA